MHSHEQLVSRLFESLNDHKSEAVADCYHQNATFHDIAFCLEGKRQIRAMWDMICLPTHEGEPSNIKVTVKRIWSEGGKVYAEVVDDYYMRGRSKRHVVNAIKSTFEFEGEKISKHTDDCDSVEWARQAKGGLLGLVIGRVHFLRRLMAMRKLRTAYPAAFRRSDQ